MTIHSRQRTVAVVTGGALVFAFVVHEVRAGRRGGNERAGTGTHSPTNNSDHPMTELAVHPFRTLMPSDAVANHSVVPCYLADRKLRVSIARVGDRLYAFDGLCTCTDEPCPLSGGLLSGTTLMCQCHGSLFDVATGGVVDGPATRSLNVYELQQVDGGIQIRA